MADLPRILPPYNVVQQPHTPENVLRMASQVGLRKVLEQAAIFEMRKSQPHPDPPTEQKWIS